MIETKRPGYGNYINSRLDFSQKQIVRILITPLIY